MRKWLIGGGVILALALAGFFGLAPVLVATLSVILLRERPDRMIIGAIAFAAIGTVVIALNGAATANPATFQAGILWSFACMIGYASYIVLVRQLAAGIHPLELVALSATGGFAVLSVVSSVVGVKLPELAGKDLLLPGLQFAYLALIATCLAYALFVSGVRATSATTGSLGALAMPPTATILAALLLNQIPTIEVVIGQVLLMSAMAVTILRTARRLNS
jgi:DME family drug/metabolite transporter